jgi:ribosome recycling factor
MVQELIAAARPKMEGALTHLEEELRTLRTGRATAQMLDSVLVPYYGTPTPLKSLATIAVQDAQSLVITPFDAGTLNDIRQGIEQSELGFRPSDDGRVLRITVPPLTAERREELVKRAHKMAEATRIRVRTIRGEVWESIQEAQKSGEISEDNRDWGRAEIDKITAEFNKRIEEVVKKKEADIRTL